MIKNKFCLFPYFFNVATRKLKNYTWHGHWLVPVQTTADKKLTAYNPFHSIQQIFTDKGTDCVCWVWPTVQEALQLLLSRRKSTPAYQVAAKEEVNERRASRKGSRWDRQCEEWGLGPGKKGQDAVQRTLLPQGTDLGSCSSQASYLPGRPRLYPWLQCPCLHWQLPHLHSQHISLSWPLDPYIQRPSTSLERCFSDTSNSTDSSAELILSSQP